MSKTVRSALGLCLIWLVVATTFDLPGGVGWFIQRLSASTSDVCNDPAVLASLRKSLVQYVKIATPESFQFDSPGLPTSYDSTVGLTSCSIHVSMQFFTKRNSVQIYTVQSRGNDMWVTLHPSQFHD